MTIGIFFGIFLLIIMNEKKEPKNIKDIVEKAAPKVFDAIEFAHHSPDALKKIDGRARDLLIKIKEKSRQLGQVSTEQLMSADESADHVKYAQFAPIDSATISFTINEDELPPEFYSNLVGGHDYLEHVLGCNYCMAMIGHDRDEIEDDEDVKRIGNAEMLKRGFKPKDQNASEIEDKEHRDIEDDLEFPKKH